MLNKKELDMFIDYIDVEHKGYIKFKDFNDKVKRNMANVDDKGNTLNTNIMAPSHAAITRLIKDQTVYKGTVKAAIERFRPENYSGNLFLL